MLFDARSFHIPETCVSLLWRRSAALELTGVTIMDGPRAICIAKETTPEQHGLRGGV